MVRNMVIQCWLLVKEKYAYLERLNLEVSSNGEYTTVINVPINVEEI
jgi:hypothetical protein